MALTDQARAHYKSLLDSTTDPIEREELLAGIKYQHTDGPGYISSNKDELRTFGQKALGTYKEPEAPQPERTFGSTLADLGVTAAKAGVGLGETALGLANIPTMGYAGKGAEALGIDLGAAQKKLDEYYSPAQQYANRQVAEAKGFGNTLAAMVENPSTIVNSVLESLPQMYGGAKVAQGLLKAGKIATPLIAGAIGEGTMQAGSAAEGIRQQSESGTLSPGQAVAAVGSGIGTGIFGVVGGKIAKSLGIGDIDTMLAGKQFAAKTEKGVIKRIIEGGISEGVFEELPQSMQEQVWMNAATGRPLGEGVGEAGAAGMLAGAAMGGGANIYAGPKVDTKTNEPTVDPVQRAYDNIITYDDPEEISNALDDLTQQVVNNNNMLKDVNALNLRANEMGITSEELITELNGQNDFNKQLINKLQKEAVGPGGRFQAAFETAPKEEVINPFEGVTNEVSVEQPVEAPKQAQASSFLEQKAKERQRKIDNTYLPAEEELDRINYRKLQEQLRKIPNAKVLTTSEDKVFAAEQPGNKQPMNFFEQEAQRLNLGEDNTNPEVDKRRKFFEDEAKRLGLDDNDSVAYYVNRSIVEEAAQRVAQQKISNEQQMEDVNTNPSDAQKEAGNYKKAHIKVDDFDITIENPAGSIRSGKDPDGKEWSSTMNGHYGYFKRTNGKDGDQVDVIVKDVAVTSPKIFVVDQVDPNTGKFDEHKVIMGTNSAQEAKDLYMSNYEDGWQGFGNITEMDHNSFKEWLNDGKRTNKPVAPIESTKAKPSTFTDEQQVANDQIAANETKINDLFAEVANTTDKATKNRLRNEILRLTTENSKLKEGEAQPNNTLNAKDMTRREFIKTGVGLAIWAATNKISSSEAIASTEQFNAIIRKDNSTVKGTLNWIANNSASDKFRTLAKDLLPLLPKEEQLSLTISDDLMTAKGINEVDRLNKKGNITLFKNGQNENTFLHEVIHATIVARYDMLNYYLANPNKLGPKNADKALAQYHSVWREFQQDARQYIHVENRMSEISEAPIWLTQPLTDPDEFITYGLTNPDFQNYLKSRSYNGKTLWQRFKDAIKGIMGWIKNPAPTWFDAFMMTSDDLIKQMKNDNPDYNTSFKLNSLVNKDTNKQFDLSNPTESQRIPQEEYDEIKKFYPNQEVSQAEDGTISVRFQNGRGATIQSMQDAGNGFIEFAIETGQMKKDGKILGATVGNKILLDSNYADNATLWHENKHVLDNLGMITDEDNSALNREFNKLRKAGKLNFALSTHENAMQAMVENRANTFAQVMTSREQYRNTPLGKLIQKIMDFFDGLLNIGRQSVGKLAREVESGKVYNRQVGNNTYSTTIPQNEVTADRWYSTMENTLLTKLNTASPAVMKQQINAWANKGEFKQEELEWSGLNEWLDKQEGKVTKQQVMDYLRENNVKVEEVIPENNKFEQYTLPGGENYKELLLTLPAKETKQYFIAYKNGSTIGSGFSSVEEAQNNLNELFTGRNDVEIREGVGDKATTTKNNTNYKSAHWSTPNVLAHIRFSERTIDGKKVLHVEEVQSDWHQEGRKKGYGDQIKIRKDKNGYYRAYDANNNQMELRVNGEVFTALESEQAVRNALPNSFGAKGVPNAPFKKSWPLLAMKRMVRYAAENGFDSIAWTPGEQQAERYDLSKQIKEIEYIKRGNNYEIAFTDMQDEGHNPGTFTPTELENVVGKEIAQKIINGEGRKYRGHEGLTLEGLDLKVGGEGMKGFYDKILPAEMNKFFGKKAWGNPKVGIISDKSNIEKTFSKIKELANKYGVKIRTTAKEYLPIKEQVMLRRAAEADVGLDYLNTIFTAHTDAVTDINSNRKELLLHELTITPEMKSKALREGMPLFKIDNPTESQRIPQADYDEIFKQERDIIGKIRQNIRLNLHEFKLMLDKGLGSTYTRLKNASPLIADAVRNLDFASMYKTTEALKKAYPLMENVKKNMSAQDKSAWDWARNNSDVGKLNQLIEKYGLREQYENVRTMLNKIRQEGIDVGYDIGFIDEYWPRVINDRQGFLLATQKISEDPIFSNAIKKQAKKMGITVAEFNEKYPDKRADIISSLILGRHMGLGGPGNIQGRVYSEIPKEFAKFYMDPDAALMSYVYSMTKRIEARRFFGKVPQNVASAKQKRNLAQTKLIQTQQLEALATSENRSKDAEAYRERIEELKGTIKLLDEKLETYRQQRDYRENIGVYVSDLITRGELKPQDEKAVRDMLEARFHEHGATGLVSAYKNLAYIDVMGNPFSAITQLGDLAWAAYIGKAWTPQGFSMTMKNVINAAMKKSNVTKEDIGIERIAQEFADATSLSRAVSKTFKMVGLEKMDSIGKEALINNAFDLYQAKTKTPEGIEALKKELRPIFGNKTNDVIADLAAGNQSYDVKLLLFHKLLDFQPVALSAMPEMYLKGGNGRIFYMLKTYTLQQFDVFRREVWHNIKSGKPEQVKSGIQNMLSLAAMLTFANAGADAIKDLILGKEFHFEDHVIENFLTMGGASRFMRMQVTREGLGSGLMGQIMPPFRFVDSISRDVFTNVEDGYRTPESIPGIGKLYYWHMGRGSNIKKTLQDQDFSKERKQINEFNDNFKKAEDKRAFLIANKQEFKKAKLFENFDNSLNRNKGLINKLKDLKQTPNVIKRIGQLEEQRRVIIDKYFELAERMQ